ncbi:MAG: SpoIIE family protein phosphatase [Phycisphaerales bacterium]|nr:SpoIIE family protein phosphatase [Phycisphaerales bacterium]
MRFCGLPAVRGPAPQGDAPLSVRWKLILGIGGPILLLAMIAIGVDSARLRRAALETTSLQFQELVSRYAAEFDGRFNTIAQIGRSAASFVETHPNLTEAELYEMLERNVGQNDLVYGSCIAFEPHTFDQRRLFAPYVYHGPDTALTPDGRVDEPGRPLLRMDVADAYDYTDPKWAWFREPRKTGKAGWTEPFFDEGAGNVAMVTFVVPFSRDGKFRGTVNMDVRLDQLTARAARVDAPLGEVAIISPTGLFISFPDKSRVMKSSIFDLARDTGVASLATLGRAMVEGGRGSTTVARLGVPEPHLIFFAPIPSARWSFAVAIPESTIMGPAYAQLRERALIAATGVMLILVLVLFLGMYITRPLSDLVEAVRGLAAGRLDVRVTQLRRRDEVGQLARAFNTMTGQLAQHVEALKREAAARETVESELRVARQIQAAMLPREFPKRREFRVFGVSAPARFVGGDFYDCFESSGGTVTIVIGDVSGKGVPAAMFMAMARTTIRDLAREASSPATILALANELLRQSNEQGMFVTLFLGRYEPFTGRLRFANGGHPAPYLLNGGPPRKVGGSTGTVIGALPAQRYEEGEMSLRPGESLFLYTDGVTEARSPRNEFFTERRLEPFLGSVQGTDAEEMCRRSVAVIDEYQAGVRADDVTVLVLERCRVGEQEPAPAVPNIPRKPA